MKYFYSILLIFFAYLQIFSQENVIYDLQDCINLAKANNISLKNSELEIGKMELTKKSAFTNFFPKISAVGTAFRSNDGFIDANMSDIDISILSSNVFISDAIRTLMEVYGDVLDIDINVNTMDRGILGIAYAMQPVFAGGRIVTGNKMANLGVEAKRYQHELSVRDVEVKTEQYFWLVTSLYEKGKTLDIVISLLDTLEKDATVAYNAGLIMKNDILKVNLKQSEMKQNKIKLDNGIRMAKTALCQHIGIDYTDSISFVEEKGEIVIPFNDSLTAADVDNRLESKLLGINLEVEKLKKKMILGGTLPQVALGAGYVFNTLMTKPNSNFMVFGVVSIPISDWWSTSYNLKKQDLEIETAANNQKNYHELLKLQMQQNRNELMESAMQIDVALEAIKEAEENIRLENDYYDAGMATMSDVLQAQTYLQQSRDSYTDAYIQYRIKLAEYNRNK